MTDRCPHCGASMKQYWHRLTPGAVSALVKLLKAVHYYNRNSVHLHNEMKSGGDPAWRLSDFEWNNFSILRFHGLAHQDEKKTHRSGYWLITKRGGQFLRGEISVPKGVKTFRDKVIDHSPELVHIRSFAGKTPEFESSKAYEYPPEFEPTKAIQQKLFIAA